MCIVFMISPYLGRKCFLALPRPSSSSIRLSIGRSSALGSGCTRTIRVFLTLFPMLQLSKDGHWCKKSGRSWYVLLVYSCFTAKQVCPVRNPLPKFDRVGEIIGSILVSGKLPTYPSPKPTLSLTSHLRAKCWIRGGVGGQFPRNPHLAMDIIKKNTSMRE